MNNKLKVAFLWHMHQPCYRKNDDRVFRLPWVRLHGLKDYADMLYMALQYPEVKVSFNLTPVLLEQLQDYATGKASDYHYEVSQKPADSLTEEERCFIIKDFFMAHWKNMIEPYPRYRELLEKRGRHFHPSQLVQLSRRFSEQDIRDLQVWFNLTWIDSIHCETYSDLEELKAKSSNFTEDDKLLLLSRQMDILKTIIPAYQKAWKQKQVELSVSPYYHPILPLLCDSDIAKESMPWAQLSHRFKYPEDAMAHLSAAQSLFQATFGQKAQGLWPSEGSVSYETVQITAESGFKWMATDEVILEKSLGYDLKSRDDGEALAYRPYILEGTASPLIFFRNRLLSDLIGFTYFNWDSKYAANDIINRLEGIADKLGSEAGNHIVPIILDGENAWESYPNDGRDFLSALYSGLASNSKLVCCTFDEYLDRRLESGRISRIFPGSWINGDFSIWIGQEEDNRAWNELLVAREQIAKAETNLDMVTKKKVYRELYTAEGSDWCWWYGGNFASENLEDFDLLFRGHLQRIYELLGKDVPSSLLSPISKGRLKDRLISEPLNLIHPVLDGRISDFYEWTGCGTYDLKQDGGTMHRAQSLLETVNFGFDEQNLYLRLDPHPQYDKEEIGKFTIAIELVVPEGPKINLPLTGKTPQGCELAFDKVIELGVPFSLLGVKPGQKVAFYVSLYQNGATIERHPLIEPITFTAPTNDFLVRNWIV